jgi:predicted permease
MSAFLQDVASALKQIRRSPRFSAFVVLLMAAGIGFNLAVFSVVDALLLRPLPVHSPDELVRFVQVMPNIDARSTYSFRFFELVGQNTGMFADVIACSSLDTSLRDESGVMSRVRCQAVSGNFFTALGVNALHGRVLTLDDERPAAGAPPVVLSYPYWQSRFLGDPGVVGREIRLRDLPFTVVGVLPHEFNGLQVEAGPDVRVTLTASDRLEKDPQIDSYRKRIYEVAARLRPGTGLPQAQAAAWNAFVASAREENLTWRQNERFEARRIPKGYSILRDKYSSALMLLMAGVALMLVMICANVGGLLLARASTRLQDTAVRMALGATSGRIARQWLAEGVLLAVLASAAGLCIAHVLAPLLVRGLPPVRSLDTTVMRLSLHLAPDTRFVLFSIVLCLAGAALTAVPPAIHSARSDLYTVLRAARTTSSPRLRWAIVGLQAALCTLVIGGTTLLVGTFWNLRAMDPGFAKDRVVSFSADPTVLAYSPEEGESLKTSLLAAVREIPGVSAAAVSSVGVMRGTGIKATVAPVGQKVERGDFLNSSMHFVTPEYFETMGIRLLEGRGFRADEPQAKPAPAVVNSAFARRFFAGVDPVGRQFGIAGVNEIAVGEFVVIGVVSDAKYRSLREPVQPTLYRPWSATSPGAGIVLHVCVNGRPGTVIPPVRRALHAIDSRLPFYDVRTLGDEVRDSMWPETALAWVSMVFSAVAVGLAAVAIYGTLAFAIACGRREIAIRMAFGAGIADVVTLNSARPLAATAIGIIVGLAALRATLPTFTGALYGVSPAEPACLLPAVLVVVLAASAATLSATRKALHINPSETLRGE